MAVSYDAKVLRRGYRYAIGKERGEFNAVAVKRRAKVRSCRHALLFTPKSVMTGAEVVFEAHNKLFSSSLLCFFSLSEWCVCSALFFFVFFNRVAQVAALNEKKWIE
jgi:hypothetical protein